MVVDVRGPGSGVIYFHGVPGAPQEIALFGPAGNLANAWAPDRNSDRTDLGYGSYFDNLASRIDAGTVCERLHLVGFSLGAVAALQVAQRLGRKVSRIDLISAAAPLELGDFLPQMAGRAVFDGASRNTRLFNGMTVVQGQLARFVPSLLLRLLFATADGEDNNLARDREFRTRITGILKHAYADGACGYRREILGFVRPWSTILSEITAPVTIWHGTADTWAPIAMADCLYARLPNPRLMRLNGLSHYSTLRAALERI